MNILLRYIPLVFAILFILFCIVQYNDPDTLTWVGIYGFMACLSILVSLKKASQWIILLAMPFYLAGFIYLWPDSYEGVTMSMGYKPGIEEARESLGLLICFVSLCVLLLIVRKQQKQ